MKFSFSHLIFFVAGSVISGLIVHFLLDEFKPKKTPCNQSPNLFEESFLNNSNQPK